MHNDEALRSFWAGVLDSEIKKDGQVPGFSAWWSKADEDVQKVADEAEKYILRAIKNGGDGAEIVGAEIERFRRYLDGHEFQPPKRSRPVYAAFRWTVYHAIRSHNLKPDAIADMLEVARETYPEIETQEIDKLRAMGDMWRPEKGVFDPGWWEREGSPAAKARLASERREALGLPNGLGPAPTQGG